MNVHNNHFLCITILIPMKKRALVKFIKTYFKYSRTQFSISKQHVLNYIILSQHVLINIPIP